MSLTLALADNADATGVTAAVAGSSGGSVTVWAMPMADGEAFAAAGSRVGDGPVALALRPRLYWVYAADGAAATPVRGCAATDGLAKLPARILAAVAARVRAIGLTNPATGSRLPVFEHVYPDETAVTYPCVVVSVEGVSESDGPDGTWAGDDRGYPARVALVDRLGTPPDHRRLPTLLGWRFAVERAFAGQYLPGVPESSACRVEPSVIADPMLPQYQHFASGVVVRCFCRVPRGLGV